MESLSKKAPEFTTLKRDLGEKNMKLIRDRELNKFKGEMEHKQKKVRNKLEDLYGNFAFWDSQIQHVLEKSVNSQIEELTFQIQQVKQQLKSQQSKFSLILNAEDELKAKIESMVESKKKEIGARTSKIMEQHGGGIDFTKVTHLRQAISSSEEHMRNLDEMMTRTRSEYGCKMEELEVKQTKITCQISQLRQEANLVTQNKKRSLRIQDKIDLINKEIGQIELVRTSLTSKHSEDSDPVKLNETVETILSPIHSPINETVIQKEFKLLDERYKAFYDLVLPLLEGISIYRKVPGKFPTFDPLEDLPLDKCGYLPHQINLNRHMTKLELRRLESSRPSYDVLVGHILSTSIPKMTSELLRAQKHKQTERPASPSEEDIEKYSEMKKNGVVDFSSPSFVALSHFASTYLFAINQKNGKSVQLAATCFKTYKRIIDALNCILKNAPILGALKYAIEYK